ncbi:MAG: hypothetical protein SPJ62_00335 [Inconstantimicrobium porci]|uniref:hypothetical protein n=1 Tax=Inconstantimicrobium porci TaxID=2652291 RepID=UPI002A918CCF|nr:hypothetical protein [Inconstantimicrobium porci]MDY5910474.1 hypothetical protein [Inconstantimicrobium porci]
MSKVLKTNDSNWRKLKKHEINAEQLTFKEKVQQISIFDKKIIRLLVDDTFINKDFTKGSEHNVFMEQGEHYIILHEGVYYGLYKSECEII